MFNIVRHFWLLITVKKYIKKYKLKVKKIRRSNVYAQIILLTANIDYNKIFNEHLELLGVIDIKKSLANTSNEISDYLDYFFNIEKVH